MSWPRTLAIALGLVVLAVVAQVVVLGLLAWLTVAPISFAGTHVPGADDARPIVTLHFGPLTMVSGALTARIVGGVPLPLTALRAADIEVYEVDDDVDAAAFLAPPGPDWIPVVRVCDEGDLVGVFARTEGRRLEELQVVVFADDEDLVRVRLSGRLDRALAALVAWGLEQAGRNGPDVRWSRRFPSLPRPPERPPLPPPPRAPAAP